MKILAIVSQKGGVGKTTLALNLSLSLSQRDWRVLLVDTDPQGGIGLSLQRPSARGFANCVVDESPFADVIVHTRFPTFDLVPIGRLAPQDTHVLGSRLLDGREITRLAAEVGGRYDAVVLDTPSGFGGVALGALRAADMAISPLQAEPVAMRSVTQLLEVIGALRLEGSRVRLGGLVLTMLQLRNTDSLSVAQEAWARFPDDLVVQTTIPRDPVFLEASHAGLPVGLLSSRPPPIAGVFAQLAQEIETRLELAPDESHDGPLPLFA